MQGSWGANAIVDENGADNPGLQRRVSPDSPGAVRQTPVSIQRTNGFNGMAQAIPTNR